jgi:hypothetical protein
MNRLRRLAIAGLGLLVLSACTGGKNLAAKDPATAAKDLTVAIRDNDLDRFSHIMVPPDDYAKMQARYQEEVARRPAPTAEEEAQFKTNVVDKYTASDAEDNLFAYLKPVLVEIGPNLPNAFSRTSGLAAQVIANNEHMSKPDKQQAIAVLNAVTAWGKAAPLADLDKAKQAIKIVVGSARDMKLTTLAALEKMNFSETMQKASVAEGGVRNALAVYGFDTDKVLGSVKVEKKSGDDSKAIVIVSFTVLDASVAIDIDMIQRDGRWYSADLVRSVEDALSEKPADANSAPVAGVDPSGNARSPAAPSRGG